MTAPPRELLPCPFCGDKALVRGILEDCSGGGSNYIECTNCGVSTKLFYSCGEDAIPHAIKNWNTRLAQPAEPPATDDLVGSLKYIGMFVDERGDGISKLCREAADLIERQAREIAAHNQPVPLSEWQQLVAERDGLLAVVKAADAMRQFMPVGTGTKRSTFLTYSAECETAWAYDAARAKVGK